MGYLGSDLKIKNASKSHLDSGYISVTFKLLKDFNTTYSELNELGLYIKNNTIMTKLEEFTALQVNVTTDFKNALEKLEKLNEQLREIKVKMDLMENKTLIHSHQEQMIPNIKAMKRFENHFDMTIKQVEIYPNWTVVMFILSLVSGMSALAFVVINYF